MVQTRIRLIGELLLSSRKRMALVFFVIARGRMPRGNHNPALYDSCSVHSIQ